MGLLPSNKEVGGSKVHRSAKRRRPGRNQRFAVLGHFASSTVCVARYVWRCCSFGRLCLKSNSMTAIRKCSDTISMLKIKRLQRISHLRIGRRSADYWEVLSHFVS